MRRRRLRPSLVALAVFAGCASGPQTVTTAPVGFPIPAHYRAQPIAAPGGILLVEPTSVQTFGPATLSRVSKGGELPRTVVLPESMVEITVAGPDLFWISDLKPARIRTSALAKPAPARTLATEAGGVQLGLAVDASHVYFTRRDDTIVRVPRAGGASEIVMTAGGRVFGVAGGNLYYFTGAEVRRVPVGGGAPSVVLAGKTVSQAWLEGADLLVRTEPSSEDALDGTLLSVPLSGGAPRTLLEGLARSFVQVSVTPKSVVVLLPFRSDAQAMSPELAVISRATGHVERRHPWHGFPLQMAASEGSLYYVTSELLQREDLPE